MLATDMALRAQAINWLWATCIVEAICVFGILIGRGRKLTRIQQGRYDVMRYGSIVGGIVIAGSVVVLIIAEFLN